MIFHNGIRSMHKEQRPFVFLGKKNNQHLENFVLLVVKIVIFQRNATKKHCMIHSQQKKTYDNCTAKPKSIVKKRNKKVYIF